MRSYSSTPAAGNSAVTVPVTRCVWSLAARIAASLRQCKAPGRHPGRARRHKQEILTRAASAWLRELLTNGRAWIGGRPLGWSEAIALAEKARRQLGRAAPNPYALRELLELVVATGPESGWGIRNGVPQDAHRRYWTPYWIGRRQDGVARRWRGHAARLSDALARAVALALQVSPTLRTASNQEKHYGEQGSLGMESPANFFEAVARRCLARSAEVR